MNSNIKFDRGRYLELLTKEADLLPAESDQLLSYQIILENKIYYNQRMKYIGLVEEYLRENNGLDLDAAKFFVWESFEILENEIRKQGIEKLSTFSMDPQATEFFSLINEIAGVCELVTFDSNDSGGLIFNQFHNLIEKIYE